MYFLMRKLDLSHNVNFSHRILDFQSSSICLLSKLKHQIISISKIGVAFEWTFGTVNRIVQMEIDFLHIDLLHYLMPVCQFHVIFNWMWKHKVYTFLFWLFDKVGLDSEPTERLKDEHDHIVPQSENIDFWKESMVAI